MLQFLKVCQKLHHDTNVFEYNVMVLKVYFMHETLCDVINGVIQLLHLLSVNRTCMFLQFLS